jgi:hypothetical protein
MMNTQPNMARRRPLGHSGGNAQGESVNVGLGRRYGLTVGSYTAGFGAHVQIHLRRCANGLW